MVRKCCCIARNDRQNTNIEVHCCHITKEKNHNQPSERDSSFSVSALLLWVEITTPALCGFLGNYCKLGMSTCLLIKVASTSSHNLTNQTSFKDTIIIEDQRQQLSVKELSLQGSTVAINKREELLYLLGARKAPH